MRDVAESHGKQQAADAVQLRYYACLWFKSEYYDATSDAVSVPIGPSTFAVTLGQIPYTVPAGQSAHEPLRFMVSLRPQHIEPSDAFTRSYLAQRAC